MQELLDNYLLNEWVYMEYLDPLPHQICFTHLRPNKVPESFIIEVISVSEVLNTQENLIIK